MAGNQAQKREGLRKKLVLAIHDLPEQGLDVDVRHDSPDLLAVLHELREGEGAVSGRVRAHIEPHPDRIDVEGTIEAALPLRCSRCTDPFPWSTSLSFQPILLRTKTETAVKGERELLAEELDVTELVGEVLDLASLVREELLLSIPEQPLCREDCKGICEGCGAELNSEVCTCLPATDHRWSKLKGWKPPTT